MCIANGYDKYQQAVVLMLLKTIYLSRNFIIILLHAKLFPALMTILDFVGIKNK